MVDERGERKKAFWFQEFNIHYELLLRHFGQQKAFMTFIRVIFEILFAFSAFVESQKPFSHDLSSLKVLCVVSFLLAFKHIK
jgi:hypothetical protein